MSDDKINFVRRFIAELARLAGVTSFSDGLQINEYAEMVAPQYFGDEESRLLGPEACAALAMDAVRERRRALEKRATKPPRPMADALGRLDTFGRLHPNRKARRAEKARGRSKAGQK